MTISNHENANCPSKIQLIKSEDLLLLRLRNSIRPKDITAFISMIDNKVAVLFPLSECTVPVDTAWNRTTDLFIY
jgi:hypothetical protein